MKDIKYRPETKYELEEIIKEHFDKGETDLNDIDTFLITNMSYLFRNIKHNFDISEWNVENVENMHGMFKNCQKFNCDISGWDVRKVLSMGDMFYNCTDFNQDIGRWKVENVADMSWMFGHCVSFEQDLSGWKGKYIGRNSRYSDLFMFLDCPIKEECKPKYFDLY